MKLKLAICSLSLVICGLAYAKHDGPNCKKQKDMTGMKECWTKANQELDQKMQMSWQKIMALPQEKAPFSKKVIDESQKLWLEYRQVDCSKYTDGSIAPIMNAKCYYAKTKMRLHEFKYICKGLGDTPIC
jgi:uncharacterized protein YecT (DUF1311 family)